MSHTPVSIKMMIRLLNVSTMHQFPRHTFLYKLRVVIFAYFLIDCIIMMSSGLHTLLSELKRNIFIGIQGGTIFVGLLNCIFKIVKLGLTDDFEKIIRRAENLYASLMKFPTAARLASEGDKIIARRASIFWKFMLSFYPVSITAALYKVWFKGEDSYLIIAFYTPHMPHYSLSMLWQLLILTPAWFILASYALSLLVTTSLVDTYVKCLIKLAEEQKEQVEIYIYKIHADIVMLVEEINNSLGSVLFFEMLISPFQSCFCAYGAMVALGHNFNGIYSSVLLIISMVLPCILSICCQSVINAGENLHNSLDSLKWFERPAKARRDIAFMALQSGRGLQIHYRRMFVFDMERFCEFLQCVMSYITIMRNLK